MKISELKKIIRQTVRECVHEMLAEKFVETMAVNSRRPSLREQVYEETEQAEPAPPRKRVNKEATERERKQLNEEIRSKLGLQAGHPMADLFEDTLINNNNLDESQVDAPGTIPESALEEIGIIGKDWSKYL